MNDILIKILEVFIMLAILLSPLNKIFEGKDGFLQGGAIVIFQAISFFLFFLCIHIIKIFNKPIKVRVLIKNKLYQSNSTTYFSDSSKKNERYTDIEERKLEITIKISATKIYILKILKKYTSLLNKVRISLKVPRDDVSITSQDINVEPGYQEVKIDISDCIEKYLHCYRPKEYTKTIEALITPDRNIIDTKNENDYIYLSLDDFSENFKKLKLLLIRVEYDLHDLRIVTKGEVNGKKL